MGFVLILIAAMSFGAMPIFARFAFAAGVDTNTMLMVRFLIGAVVMIPLVWLTRTPWPKGKYFWAAVGLGAGGFFLEALSFFYALTMASTGIVTLLLYLYPSLVALASAFFFGEHLSKVQLAAIGLALFGMALIVSLTGQNTPMGIALGVASAFIYTAYVIGCGKVTAHAPPLSTAAVIIASAALSYAALVLVTKLQLPTPEHQAQGWLALTALGVISTVFAIGCFVAGAHRIGATQASVVASVEPVITLTLAYVVLGESMTPRQILGACLVMSSVILLAAVNLRRPHPIEPEIPAT